MAKRWLNSADVQIDDATGALLVRLASGYRVISAPAAVTATAGQWTAIDLPEGTQYVHVGVSEDTYLVAQSIRQRAVRRRLRIHGRHQSRDRLCRLHEALRQAGRRE